MTKGGQKTFFQGGVILGMLLPALLTIIALSADVDTPIVAAFAAVSALVGMFMSETAFIRAGQSVPLS
jgi:formate-dependent nitrite reductase membrane component NrfD